MVLKIEVDISERGSNAKCSNSSTEAKEEQDEKTTVLWREKKKTTSLQHQEDDFGFLYAMCSEELNFVLFIYITRTVSKIFHH